MEFHAETSRDIHTEFFRSERFDLEYVGKVPIVLASLATYKGIDNSHLRYRDLGLYDIDFKVEEDTTANAEFSHSAGESISYLAISGQDPLTAVTTSIPDGGTRSFNVDFSEDGRVGDMDVNLDLVHTVIEDLDIFLQAPDGTMVELLTDLVADGDLLTDTTLDDKADQSITAGNAPYTGRFQPGGLLSEFLGKYVTGTWTLHVTDDTADGNRDAFLRGSLDVLLAPNPPGNLNYDSFLDAADIDLLFVNFGSSHGTYDLDVDGDVDKQDIDQLVQNIMGNGMVT